MRYIWSEIDSPATMLKRLHPSRLVVFSCSRRWKKGTGEVGFGGWWVWRGGGAPGRTALVGVSRDSQGLILGCCMALESVKYQLLMTMALRKRTVYGAVFRDAG